MFNVFIKGLVKWKKVIAAVTVFFDFSCDAHKLNKI
ncbi:hypothetical protein HMPREF9629_00191 [Peptoanaerobacter stomatis]|uniref:Uncharacterized protein n=1 Tax=Peptoanaerobacter stomatis TaxID=796937 RepID=G9WXV2_9FIRM|nr:hypothetical protein HMPREF9629_00191 [Peptoanaerobacter stomatis]